MPEHTSWPLASRVPHAEQVERKKALGEEAVVQPGIAFPSASDQTHLLIVRLNLAPLRLNQVTVSRGLKRLCQFFADIDSGKKNMEVLNDKTGLPEQKNLRKEFHFSATIGFGEGFFDLLGIGPQRRPSKLKTMPDHQSLGDVTPYSLAQTDLILQLGSSSAFVNRWVLENTLQLTEEKAVETGHQGDGSQSGEVTQTPDIVTAVSGWATIADFHAGFQRTDGRNLQGFNDGVSNPRAGSDPFNKVVWSRNETNEALNQGTYMVFQKIIHDLDQWRELTLDEQQEWVGRSKGTGLLLGTLSEAEDDKLADGLRAGTQEALDQWKKLFRLQSNPRIPFFDPDAFKEPSTELRQALKVAGFEADEVHTMAKSIVAHCPAWSHVRKVNPRGADKTDFRIMFRRGYPFMEPGSGNKLLSGLLFVSFQDDIEAKFEFLKSAWAGNKNFPTPLLRPFNEAEKKARHQMGRFSAAELEAIRNDMPKRILLGLTDNDDFADALKEASDNVLTQQTGREGLAGPSELGTVPSGEFLAIVPLGGGYYFVPPIPNGNLAEIGQQFFEAVPSPAQTRPQAKRYRGAMNVVVGPRTRAEEICRRQANASLERPTSAAAPTAPAIAAAREGQLAPGLPATPEHNLVFRGGRVLPHLIYVNFYVGQGKDWEREKDDVRNINAALEAALRDPRLESVIGQYFPRQAISATFRGPSEFLGEVLPTKMFSRGNVTEFVMKLHQAGRLTEFDLTTTVFNFLLPRGTVLTDDAAPATAQTLRPAPRPRSGSGEDDKAKGRSREIEEKANSLEGLAGYHGSVPLGGGRFAYFAVGVYSDHLDDTEKKPNGIIAFDKPWKNVVATLYHELCEARTDPDVEQANSPNNTNLAGWTSDQGEEIGDFPIFEDPALKHVFKEVPLVVPLADGTGTVPIQLQYSNRVNGPEDPTI